MIIITNILIKNMMKNNYANPTRVDFLQHSRTGKLEKINRVLQEQTSKLIILLKLILMKEIIF